MFICPMISDQPTEIGRIHLITINDYSYQMYIVFCNIIQYYPKKHKRYGLSFTELSNRYDISWRPCSSKDKPY